MTRIAIFVMAVATAVFAQAPATSQSPAGTQPAQAVPAPATKRPIQAKTKPEYDAYTAAHASANDPAAMEQAANDFAGKFPDSDLRVLLYRDAMHAYQRANQADKMLEMGRQVLKLDSEDPEAMIGVAEVLTERTHDTDLDKDQRLAEASKLAQHALETVDTNISVPAGVPAEQVDAYKRFLRSSAYAIIGTQLYNKDNFKDAEDNFRKSIDAFPSQPDPIVVLRLALSLDKQEKYAEALTQANRAMELTANQPGSSVAVYAKQEHDRLVQLAQGTAPAPKPATETQPAPPKN